MAGSPLIISDCDPIRPDRFRQLAVQLRVSVGVDALGVDHIGSTSLPGLVAKDVIDIQITVHELGVADGWPDELLPGLVRRVGKLADHIPAGASIDGADWDKRYWSNSKDLHVHVWGWGGRISSTRSCSVTTSELTLLQPVPMGRSSKRSGPPPDDWGTYNAVKDPACDLILAGAEQWAARIGWSVPPGDG